MPQTHEIRESHGHILDVLTNVDQTMSIAVSRRGAELVSLVRDDVGFLWRDGDVSKNPSGWNNHATVLGYYVHRLLGEVTAYHGKTIRGGTHSFLRHAIFPAPEVGEGKLTYRLSSDTFEPEQYPFRVDFTLTYVLRDIALEVIFRFDSHESQHTHVSFGLHPGFGVTSLAGARVHLPPGKYRRHLAPENFLSGEIQEFDFAGGLMPFDKSALPDSYLLDLADVADRTFILEDPATGRRVTLDFAQAPYLTLWSDGNTFICIEPCWGLPDHHDQRPFELKEGIQTISPMGHLERSFRILPEVVGMG